VDQQVVSGITLVRASHGDGVGDLVRVAYPFLKRFPACLCGEIDAMLSEEAILLGDRRRFRKSSESVFEIADGSPCLDAGVSIDQTQLFQPAGLESVATLYCWFGGPANPGLLLSWCLNANSSNTSGVKRCGGY
jgi:hypothetical protein